MKWLVVLVTYVKCICCVSLSNNSAICARLLFFYFSLCSSSPLPLTSWEWGPPSEVVWYCIFLEKIIEDSTRIKEPNMSSLFMMLEFENRSIERPEWKHTTICWGLLTWRTALQKRTWGSWWTPSWTGKQQCGLARKKANFILDCIRWLLAGQERWSFPSLLSSGEVTLWVLCQILGSSVQDILERVHHEDDDSEHLSNEERLRELGLFRLLKRRLSGILDGCIETWRVGAKRTETLSSQWCPVIET